MHDDLDAVNAHVSVDYVSPKDPRAPMGVTSQALRDRDTQLLAGHGVDAKRVGPQKQSVRCCAVFEIWDTTIRL